MSEQTQPSRADGESAETSEQATRTEYVERSDVGVSLTVKLKRETILHFLLLERGIKIYG